MLGIDLLGGAKYLQVATDAYGSLQGYAAGLFWKQFGDGSELVKKLSRAGCKTFRIHILWEYSHDYSSRVDQTGAIDEFEKCVKCFHGNSAAQLYIFLFCENKLSSQTVSAAIQRAWDRFQTLEKGSYPVPTFVNSSVGGTIIHDIYDTKTRKTIKVINEIHIPQDAPADGSKLPGKPGNPYMVSPDGWNLTSAGAARYNSKYSDALIRFAWNQSLNLHPKAPSKEEIVTLGKLLTKTT